MTNKNQNQNLPVPPVQELSVTEVRMRVIEAVMPPASRLGLNNPETIAKIAHTLEQYVMNGYSVPEVANDSTDRSGDDTEILTD